MVTPDRPQSDRSGGDLRLCSLLEVLAGRHRVALYPDWFSPDETTATVERLRGAGVQWLPATGAPGLERVLAGRPFDLVLFEFWWAAEAGADLVRRHQPWAPIVVDTVDIQFRRGEAALRLGLSDPAKVEGDKRRELDVYRRADAVVCVSEEDGRALDDEGAIPPRVIIPLVVPERPRTPGPRGPELLFLGGFRHPPNGDGLLWFAREAWGAIRAAVPDARLTVIGSDPTAEIIDLAKVEGIDVMGYVPEIGPYLDRAALMVAPLRYGSGVKTKVVEAMAAGLPVVTTSVGVQGLDARPDEHLMIADEPAAFARRVAELLGDPGRAERIGRAGRALVAELHSPAAIEARLGTMLAMVSGPLSPMRTDCGWWAKRARSSAFRARCRLGRFRRALLRSPS